MLHIDMHFISCTYTPVVSMWVVTLYSLFLYSDTFPSTTFLLAQATF